MIEEPTAEELIRAVEKSGGRFELEGESVMVRGAPKELVAVLRELKPEVLRFLKGRFVYLDVPCRCDEKPHPHFRHRDGSGPGSGKKLEPENQRQAHGSRK